MESIEASDTNGILDIVVLMDSYNTDINGTGYTTPFQDGYYHLTGGDFHSDLVTSISEVNSGSVTDSTAFFDWALANYSSDYTVYSVFNHGGGFDDENIEGTYGIAFDDNSNDSLSHKELGTLTAYLKSALGKKLDLFYPFACLMGGVELAYEVKDNAEAMVFSEELFPADYWSWEGLSAIIGNPAISGTSLASNFCGNAYTYFSNPSVDRAFTLAAVDLSKIESLSAAIDTFADQGLNYLNSNPDDAAWLDSMAAGGWSMGVPYYTDLNILMLNYTEYGPLQFRSSASSVMNALSSAVVNFKHHNYYDVAKGVSIFHNLLSLNESGFGYSTSTFSNILQFGSNSWVDYLDAINSLKPAGDTYEPDYPSTANTLAVNDSAQTHSFHVAQDTDSMLVSLTAGQTYTIQTHPSSIAADTVLLLLDSTGIEVLAINDDISISTNNFYSKINYTPDYTGDYVIIVMDYYSQMGDYTIDVRQGTYSDVSNVTPLPSALPKYPDYSDKKGNLESFVPKTPVSYRK